MSLVANSTALAADVNYLRDTICTRHFGGIPSMVHGYCDQVAKINSDATTSFYVEVPTKELQQRTITSDWATATVIWSMVVLSSFVYVYVRDASNNFRVYRYSMTNIAAGGTLMTISGQAFGTNQAQAMMTSNGTDFFFNYKGNTTANAYTISRYSLSGTTLTYVSDITCGAVAGVTFAFVVDASLNVYGISNVDTKVRKYNSAGTLQYTTNFAVSTPSNYSFLNILGFFFVGYTGTSNDNNRYERIFLP